MQQLSALDATFVHLESARTPMHIGSLCIYNQSTAQDGLVTFKGILEMIEGRLHLARSFRERLVQVPMQLDHPYWINDPDFDIEFHVRHIALPAPGDWRQLCIQVARLHSRPLDLDRPLWEFTVIEGLDNIDRIPKGSFAIASKVHHAAIDGVSGAEMSAAIHDLSPEIATHTTSEVWRPDSMPTPPELLARAGWNNFRQPLRLPQLLAETVPAIRKLRGPDIDLPTRPGDVPRTRFSGKVSAHRVFEGRTFDLADVKAIKAAVPGGTVNDAVLAICGGALRRYLAEHDELPEASLVAMAPVSVRSENQKGTAGNQVATMSVALRTDLGDPLERLEAVHTASSNAKELNNAVGASLLTDYTQFVPSVTMAMASRLYSRLGGRIAPPFNCVVTNVPGPQFPLYSTGAEMVSWYGYGPIVDGLGLFMPILSYNGRLTVSVTSCRDMMPDPGFFAECIQASFDELHAAAVPAEPASTKKPAKKEPAKKSRARKTGAAKKGSATTKTGAAKGGAAKKSPAKKRTTKKPAAKNP